MKKIIDYTLWTIYSIASLLISIWLAWQISAQINFLYPVWYSTLNIEQTIDETMPNHLYKKEFIATDTQEHYRLFSEIVSSIQNSGEGLEQIVFYAPGGHKLGQLLTRDEIIHLQDVANLIDQLSWVALAILLFCLMIMAAIIFFTARMPSIRNLAVLVVSVIILFVTGILLVGAKKFFYWLHTVVFPNDHQWFFYYEESLMSTLMKAPYLFAPISIMLLLIALFIWMLHLALMRKFSGFKLV